MRLAEFNTPNLRYRERGLGLEQFLLRQEVTALGWPDDVLEQWLYDHPGNSSFLNDYGAINLLQARWSVKAVSVEDLASMPTGPSDQGCIEEFAKNPDHWIGNRNSGCTWASESAGKHTVPGSACR